MPALNLTATPTGIPYDRLVQELGRLHVQRITLESDLYETQMHEAHTDAELHRQEMKLTYVEKAAHAAQRGLQSFDEVVDWTAHDYVRVATVDYHKLVDALQPLFNFFNPAV